MQKDQKEGWEKRMNDLEEKNQYYIGLLFLFFLLLPFVRLLKRKDKKN